MPDPATPDAPAPPPPQLAQPSLPPTVPPPSSAPAAPVPTDFGHPATPALVPPPELAPVATTRQWLPALQSLRGLAALWVVLYHLQVYLGFMGQPLLPIPGLRVGWLGVDLFFVLSAYLLGQPFIDGRAPRWPRFVADRFLRIAPPYYASFAATAAAYAMWAPAAWFPHLAAYSLAFLSVFRLEWMLAINPAYWSLAVEVQFYLLLPLLARGFRGRGWPLALAACVAVSVGYRAWMYDLWLARDGGAAAWALQLEAFTLPAFLGHFGAGLAIARIRLLDGPLGSGVRRTAFALGALLVLLPVLAWVPPVVFTFAGLSWPADVLVRPVAAFGFALVVLATASGGWVARALGWRPLEWLGAISYSLYLIHIPVQVLLLQVVDVAEHRWEWAALATVGSILAGWALYRAVEAPAEAWRRRRKLRRLAAARARAPSPP